MDRRSPLKKASTRALTKELILREGVKFAENITDYIITVSKKEVKAIYE